MDEETIRKSITRISFKWPTTVNNKKEIVTVVLCGVIVSINDDGSCLVVADPTFFHQKNCPFVVNLPTADGYDPVPVTPSAQLSEWYFYGLVLPVQTNDYVRPITIETRPVRTCDGVSSYFFAREDYIMSLGYSPGSIVCGEESQEGRFDIQIPFHSYAHFGSPIFDERGHLVGISNASMGARSVGSLQRSLFRKAKTKSLLGSVSYVLRGNPIPPESLNLPDGQVPPN